MSALVILGAGSSYDSVANHSLNNTNILELLNKPPLADQLFENRQNFAQFLDQVPHLGAIVARLRDRMSHGATLEDELALLEETAQKDPRAAQQLMAVRFYLQRVTKVCGDAWSSMAHGATNFHVLVDEMVRWSSLSHEPVVFVTFNYDTMLEKAISDELSYAFGEMGSYVAREDVKVFKLHGSVDWGHHARANVNGTPHDVIRHAFSLDVPTTFEIRRGDWNSGQGGELWVPALAVPVRTKSVFECPQEHLDLLWGLLPTVDRVLVIGWAGMEDHFLVELRDRLRFEQRAVVVACGGPDSSRSTWDRVANWPGKPAITVRGGPAVWEEDLSFSTLFSHEAFQDFVSQA